MKNTALLLFLLSLISTIYSYQIDNSNRISFPEIESTNKYFDEETGFPDVEVVNGPIHYENNDEYIDVFGTIDNYIKSYLQSIEYRVTDHFHRFGNSVFVDMIQQYNGVDIDGTYLRFVLDCVNGNFEKVTANILKPDFSGDDFVSNDIKTMFDYLNENQFNGVLGLSKIKIDEEYFDKTNNEYIIENVPFSKFDVYVKKNYLILNSTTVQPTWRFRFDYIYQEPLKYEYKSDVFYPNENQSIIYLNDENGDIIVDLNFDFHEDDIEKLEQKYATIISTKRLITTTSKPIDSTSKTIPKIVTTTMEQIIPTSDIPVTTTASTTQALPVN